MRNHNENLAWIKKHSDKTIEILDFNSATKKTNILRCKSCKNESFFCIKTMRKNPNKTKLTCPICNPPKNKRILFEDFNKRVLSFNKDYIVKKDSFKNTSAKVMVTHDTCGNTWNPIAKDLMDQKSNCPFCMGRMKWNLNNLKTFSKKYKIEVTSFDETATNSSAKFKCEKNHTFIKRPANFKKDALIGNPCPKCSVIERGLLIRKYYFQDISDIALKRGYQLLTSKEVIDTNKFSLEKNKLKLRCPKMHTFNVSFNNFHNNGSDCPACIKDVSIHYREKLCRNILEHITKVKFTEFRIPKSDSYLNELLASKSLTLSKNPLSLDGYSKKLKIAFEHQGQQHYQFIKRFHKNIEKFEKQKTHDLIKKKWCEQNGIKLITIPYKISDKNLISFISKKLGVNIKDANLPEISYFKKVILEPDKIKEN